MAAAPVVVPVAEEEVPLAVVDLEEDDDEEETLQGLVEEAEEAGEEQDLVSVAEEEVPLANNVVEEVKKCATHFWVWILTAIMSVFYVGSTRKQKKELEELRNGVEDK